MTKKVRYGQEVEERTGWSLSAGASRRPLIARRALVFICEYGHISWYFNDGLSLKREKYGANIIKTVA